MSRRISGKPPRKEEMAMYGTDTGKLVITDCMGHTMLCLINNNRLLRACVLQDSANSVGSIFIGKVKKVVSNINSCFVEIADGKIAFLSLEEKEKEKESAYVLNRPQDGRLLEGDEILVQVIRDALKTKQEAVTTKISLAGRYVVFSVGSPKLGISGKIGDSRKKQLHRLFLDHGLIDSYGNITAPGSGNISQGELSQGEKSQDAAFAREQFKNIPAYGAILRTESAEAAEESILEEFQSLRMSFLNLFQVARYRTCFTKLYSGVSPCEAALAQITESYSEAVTDHGNIYEALQNFFQGRDIRVRLYTDQSYPLHRLFSLETKLEEAMSRRIWLKSGVYLIIDQTEALTIIDVNSGKYDAKKASEEAAYQINLEAVTECARQIRLRNLSGIILIDLINMFSAQYESHLLHEMRRLTADDKIQTNVIDITRLGLMEITRKKVNKTLEEQLKRGERKG